MRFAFPLLPGLLALLLSTPQWVGGQESTPSLGLVVSSETHQVSLRVGNLLEDRNLQEALISGLPLRIRIVTELWRKRFFDAQEGQAEWRATVAYDPLERRYLVEAGNPGEVRSMRTLEEARLMLQRNFDAPLAPTSSGRFYYLATIEVETLSVSDLDELQQWLRGDLATVISGDRRVESALGRGFRRAFIRLLALPVQRYQLRSPTFRHD